MATEPDDGDRLLAAVIADPDDDNPRLAYADWLQERDDAPGRLHGELIALQVELNGEQPEYLLDWKTNVEVHDGSADHRIRRAAEIVRELSLRPFRQGLGGRDLLWRAVWRRGFVERVRCQPTAWYYHGDWLLAQTPLAAVEFDSTPPLRFTRSSIDEGETPDEWVATSAVNWRERPGVTVRYRTKDAAVTPLDINRWFWTEGVRVALSQWWPRLKPEQWEFPQ